MRIRTITKMKGVAITNELIQHRIKEQADRVVARSAKFTFIYFLHRKIIKNRREGRQN